MNELLKSQLRLVIMPTRFVPQSHQKELSDSYAMWKEVWDVAFKSELNVKDHLYSDNFTRQSHLAILFNGSEPVILTTLNYLDLRNRIDLDDSYFKVWSEISMEKLKRESSTIMTCGNLALNFNYRRGALGVSAKDLIFYLLVKHLKHTTIDAMVAAVRVEKGMDKAAYRTGAHSIMRNVPYTIPEHFVDLVSWQRDLDESDIDPELKKLANWIWLNNTEIVDLENHQGESNAA